MKKKRTGKTGNLLMTLGILLVAAAMSLVIFTVLSEKRAAERANVIVSELYELMPRIKQGVSDDRENVMMPMLELDSESFVGIIEVPLYNVKLPVGGAWDPSEYAKYPLRFTGSLYNGSLVIGGYESSGQLGFLESITLTDEVYFTDVMGCRYGYEVAEVYITSDISAESFSRRDSDLVIFAKDPYKSEYTIVILND